jgi:hypothetical protein
LTTVVTDGATACAGDEAASTPTSTASRQTRRAERMFTSVIRAQAFNPSGAGPLAVPAALIDGPKT